MARQSGETALCVRAQDVAPRLGAARRFPRAQKPAPALPPPARQRPRRSARPPRSILRGFLHRVAGRGLGLRLQPMEIIGGLLRVAGGGEDRALVVLQDLKPRRDIGGVVVAGFRRDASRRIKTPRRFRRQAPPSHSPHRQNACGLNRDQGGSGGESNGSSHAQGWRNSSRRRGSIQLRHLHDVAVGAVKSPVAAVLNGRLGAGKETLGAFKPRDVVVKRRHGRIKMRGQAVDLLGVENRVALHERNFGFRFCALLVRAGLGEGVGVNDKRAFFAFANLSAKLGGLLVGQPQRASYSPSRSPPPKASTH